jgi:hypothetical protein
MSSTGQIDIERRFREAYCLHHNGAMMMEAQSSSEISVCIYQVTQHNVPEDNNL